MPRRPTSHRKQKSPRSIGPLILVLIGIGLVIGMMVLLSRPSAQQQTSLGQAGDIPFPEIDRVELDESFQAYRNQTAVFLDVRSQASYETSHIPGAINIPLNELGTSLSELDKDDWIITYCT